MSLAMLLLRLTCARIHLPRFAGPGKQACEQSRPDVMIRSSIPPAYAASTYLPTDQADLS